MKSLMQWSVRNTPAMNTLMIAAMLVGAVSLAKLRREVFPEFDLEIMLVSVPYPGASPDEVEEGICQKIEEAVRAIEGIKKQTSVAQEGAGFVVIELESNIKDVQKILNEVRSEVDRIPSFPLFAEDPEVKQITMRQPVISVGVLGPDKSDADPNLNCAPSRSASAMICCSNRPCRRPISSALETFKSMSKFPKRRCVSMD